MTTAMLPISNVELDPNPIRPVDGSTDEFKSFISSLEEHGQLTPIIVRPKTINGEPQYDKNDNPVYVVMGGNRRLKAARVLGWSEIEAKVIVPESGEDALLISLQENIAREDMKPGEIAKTIQALLSANPDWSLADVANVISKTEGYVSKILGLAKLNDNIMELIDTGEISLTNAYQLRRLPEEEQPNYIDRAKEQPSYEFAETVKDRLKKIREQKNENANEFSPLPRPVTNADLREMYHMAQQQAGDLSLETVDLSDPQVKAGMYYAMACAVRLDPDNVEKQRLEWEEKQAEKEERRSDKPAPKAKQPKEAKMIPSI